MKRCLQSQKGVVPLVSNQERRALMAPVINRLATGRQAFVLLHSVCIGFRLPLPPKNPPGGLFSVPRVLKWTIVLLAYRPTSPCPVPLCPDPPRPALPRPAPPRPAVPRSEPPRPWCVRVLDSTGEYVFTRFRRRSKRHEARGHRPQERQETPAQVCAEKAPTRCF